MSHLEPLRCPLLFTSTHGATTREARQLQLRARRGALVRVHQGVYADARDWHELDARERHVVLTRAVVAGLDPQCTVSHASAAACWGLPRVHDDPGDVVTVVDPRRTTARRSTHLLRRPGSVPSDDRAELHGLLLTSLERTAVDVSRTASFADAVMCLDAVLRRLVLPDGHRTGAVVQAEFERARAGISSRLGPASSPGGRTARRALAFSSAWAENGGESLLRVVLFELGLSSVELQKAVEVDGLFVGRCDVFLRAFGVAIEFDGHVKLTDPEMLAGRTPAEVVRQRGRRDRRLLRHPEIRHVVHCEYADLVFPERLVELLRAAGVAIDPRRVSAAARIAGRRFSGTSA
ncbi:hypothetical protein ABID81_002399 [Frigoribacterium sp. PvP054]